MLSHKDYRKDVVDNIKDPVVKSFWVDEFAKYTDRFAAEATPAIQNKVGQFLSAMVIRNIVGQQKSAIDMRKVMDEGKILIMNLSKGRIGDQFPYFGCDFEKNSQHIYYICFKFFSSSRSKYENFVAKIIKQ
jgi:hypothetical protein